MENGSIAEYIKLKKTKFKFLYYKYYNYESKPKRK